MSWANPIIILTAAAAASRAELKKLRADLNEEADEEVKDELKSDIDGLKKKKDEWAMLLGIKE